MIEAQRIQQRVEYDLEMISEIGYVNGIENYSRYFDGRDPGDPPYTLFDYYTEAAKKEKSDKKDSSGNAGNASSGPSACKQPDVSHPDKK